MLGQRRASLKKMLGRRIYKFNDQSQIVQPEKL